MNVSRSVSYWRFGFVPRRSWKATALGWLIGHRNLLKRLQAPEVLGALGLAREDTALDFGCGAGFFTVEMSKLARRVVGIDVAPALEGVRVPERLRGRLSYVRASGAALPLADATVDVVLASEVLPMSSDARPFLDEIRRVLRPGGRLVVVNGAGHPAIRAAYESRPRLLRWLASRYPERMPASYEDYCARLQGSFGTARQGFLSSDDVRSLLTSAGFEPGAPAYSPGAWAGALYSWSMFLLYLRTGRTLSQRFFLPKFLALSLLRPFDKARYEGGLILVATRR
jgi:SAM-dependent methyltransferase